MNTAKYLFEIEILAENICLSANTEIGNVKFKILYLIEQYGVVSPSLLIGKIGIAKTNLALACRDLIKDNFIASNKSTKDGRGVEYCITPKGEDLLKQVYENLEKNFRKEEMTTEFKKAVNTVLSFLNKKV
ncbi:MAG: MarR family transcriptional regulator [Clostridia bacterium]|nr:MarR family transcriptional regulator [Clostridia bacterium]